MNLISGSSSSSTGSGNVIAVDFTLALASCDSSSRTNRIRTWFGVLAQRSNCERFQDQQGYDLMNFFVPYFMLLAFEVYSVTKFLQKMEQHDPTLKEGK